jgi:two-component sensor histidine kinase
VDAVVSLLAGTLAITVEKRIAEFKLDSKPLFPLGIILNELLTNIMKYAFTGRSSGAIGIELFNKQETVHLTIQDNGIGLPEGFSMATAKGFGLMLVRILSEQLGQEHGYQQDIRARQQGALLIAPCCRQATCTIQDRDRTALSPEVRMWCPAPPQVSPSTVD